MTKLFDDSKRKFLNINTKGYKSRMKVHKAIYAIDGGAVVYSDIATMQMKEEVSFALTTPLKSVIAIKCNLVQQTNLYHFPLLTQLEIPVVEKHIMKSNESPAGVGS